MTDRADIEAEMDAYMEGEYWPAEVLAPTGGTDEEGVDEIAPEPEAVPNHTAANGIFRRLKRLGNEAAMVNRVVDDDVARLEAFRRDRLAGIERDVAWAARALEPYARAVIPGTGKKSLALPDGTLKLKAPPEKGSIVVTDLPAFLAWAYGIDPVDDGLWVGDLPDPADDPVVHRLFAEAVVGFIVYALRAAAPRGELLRVKAEPAAAELAKLERGPWEPAEDGKVRAPLLLPHGEMVPGVVAERPAQDKFDYQLGED